MSKEQIVSFEISKEEEKLLLMAKAALNNAYAPYSNFRVGAALVCESGKIYLGTNCENASYGAAICAERSAIAAAVSNGERKIKIIAVVAGKSATSPCGICRQVLAEFADGNSLVIYADEGLTGIKKMTVFDLLPDSFSLDH